MVEIWVCGDAGKMRSLVCHMPGGCEDFPVKGTVPTPITKPQYKTRLKWPGLSQASVSLSVILQDSGLPLEAIEVEESIAAFPSHHYLSGSPGDG